MRIATILPLLLALLLPLAACGPSRIAEPAPPTNGERTYTYSSGEPKLIEDYVDGELVKSRWYSPAGTLVYETRWNRGSGTGIYLREDGSLHVRMEYKNGLAHGPAVYYDEEGRITRIVEFRDGQPIAGD